MEDPSKQYRIIYTLDQTKSSVSSRQISPNSLRRSSPLASPPLASIRLLRRTKRLRSLLRRPYSHGARSAKHIRSRLAIKRSRTTTISTRARRKRPSIRQRRTRDPTTIHDYPRRKASTKAFRRPDSVQCRIPKLASCLDKPCR